MYNHKITIKLLTLYLHFICSNANHWQSFASTTSNTGHTHADIQQRDINFGGIFSIHKPGTARQCGENHRDAGEVQYVEAMKYAINEINLDKNILGNIKLGYVILDDCATPEFALGQALHFIPLYPKKLSNCTTCNEYPLEQNFFNVWGVLGAESSPSTIMVANVLSNFHIPVISPFATGDVLSDKTRFPYFLRMVPPDHYQVQAILALLKYFNWSYISILHSKGEYGEGASKKLRALVSEAGICVATSAIVTPECKPGEYQSIIQKLHKLQSRVVVLFTDQEESRLIFYWVQKLGLEGYFVWVGGDGLGLNIDDLDGVENAAAGSLSLATIAKPSKEFFSNFESNKPTHDSHPWIKEMWTSLFDCTWEKNTDDRLVNNNHCSIYNNLREAPDYTEEITVTTIIDTMYIFASALHSFINDTCPMAFNNLQELFKCRHNRAKYFDFLKNITLQRESRTIRFDERGDILGKYQVFNLQLQSNGTYKPIIVGFWDSNTLELSLNDSQLKWHKQSAEGVYKVPESRCGELCKAGEVYNYYRDTCCWDCRKCEPNEIVRGNNSRCEDCPLFTWPDKTNFSVCRQLTPAGIPWANPIIILFITVTSLGVIACCLVFVCFITHNNNRLIKATSRELSYIMLIGITVQYMLPLSIIAIPNQMCCQFNYIGFNVSFTIVYSPLLTRTNRIYRIFRNGGRLVRKPTMTSPLSQVFIALLIILFQAIMNVISVVWIPPDVELRMPKETEPIVEETCTFPIRGFVASLCYNLLLVFICSFYAFKTRKLPDNFNESRYIALSVYTTLVIWIVFLPSYFVNNRAFHQVILLCSATLLNGTVNLLCLYIPKIYAALCSDENIKFSYRTTSSNTSHELHKCIGKAMPMNCKLTHVASEGILHSSQSKPSLDESTRRQSLSYSDGSSGSLRDGRNK